MRFDFDEYVLDLDQRELRREGGVVPIEPQVFDLIGYLIAERHRVISKDELIATIWSGRSVSDSTLTSRVNAARKAIGDSGDEQKLIRTYARRGLRFVGNVREEPHNPPIEQNAEATDIPDKPLVSVLPFRDLSPDAEQAWLAQGVSEDIATALGRHRSITVCSFAADRDGTVGRFTLEGSVRHFGERVRVSAQLIGDSLGAHLWANRFDVSVAKLPESLDEVTDKIAARVEMEVGAYERLRSEHKPQQLLSASDYLQLGLKHFYRASPADNLAAQQHFRRAISIDPSLAQAHSLLSYAIVLEMVYHGAEIDDAALDEAVRLGRSAVGLDDRDAMSRFALGRALLARRDYRRAMAEMRLALDLNPALAIIHCGLADSLTYESRFEEAIPHFEKAIELAGNDPQRWAYMAYRSLAHLFAGEYEKAALWAERATQVPAAHYWPYAHRVSALGHVGASEEIEIAVAELQQLRPDFSCTFARERLFFIKDDAHLRIYVDGLQKAGLPQ